MVELLFQLVPPVEWDSKPNAWHGHESEYRKGTYHKIDFPAPAIYHLDLGESTLRPTYHFHESKDMNLEQSTNASGHLH